MTVDATGSEPEPRGRSRLSGARPLGFIFILILGLGVAAIPLEAASEISSNGGATAYCKAEDAQVTAPRSNPRIGMIQCSGDRPDYFPALPLYLVGGATAAAGLIGITTRVVLARRASTG